MKGLFIKDVLLMKNQRSFFILIICMACALGFFALDPSFLIGYISFIWSLFVISSISYDEFNNGNAFLFSLPISRKLYVIEKYAFGLFLGVISILVSTALACLLQVVKGSDVFDEIFITAFFITPIVIMLIALMLPIHFKFGAEKGRIAMFITVGMIFLISYLCTNIAQLIHISLNDILIFIYSLGTLGFTAIIFIISLIILVLSCQISISIMNKKEF